MRSRPRVSCFFLAGAPTPGAGQEAGPRQPTLNRFDLSLRRRPDADAPGRRPTDLRLGVVDPRIGDRHGIGHRRSSDRVIWVRRWLRWSFPALLGSVPLVAGLVVGGEWYKPWRESARAFPPAGSPNVLLVVLDTVRADHLNLYGYPATPAGRSTGWRSGASPSRRPGQPPPGTLAYTRACSPAGSPTSSA